MRLLILYGSQTGTAQDVAEQLWRSSKSYGFEGPVLPMDDYPVHKLVEESLVLFVVATTGDGDEPENMRNFWKFLLRRSLPTNSLENLQYACLGLGDSTYAKFNYAAKKLNKRLQQLGGKQIIPLGLCDDQHDHGFGAVSLPWMDQLWQEMEKRLGIRADCREASGKVFKWQCKVLNNTTIDYKDNDHIQWPHKDEAQKFTLLANERTTDPKHFQDVRLLQFESNNERWFPGDIFQVQPHNSEQQVDEFFSWVQEHQLDFGPDTVVEVTSNFVDMPLPKCFSKPLSLRQMATYLWDLSHRPRQRAFELLALQCEDELEKEKLMEFTTTEGLDSLISYINRPRRTILEVLQDFRQASSKLTLNVLIELFSFIQPRSFSIASCMDSSKLDLLVAVVEYKTKLSKPRLGLCSNWLKSLVVGKQIFGCIKMGTMKLPKDAETPIIMVGPGTGVAPFRSVIQSRHYQLKELPNKRDPLLVLYFGCRNKNKDYHFQHDLEFWSKEGILSLHCAFSRDQESKIYVQHLIEKNAEQLQHFILEQRAVILVAGSSKNMPKSVKEAFIKVLNGQEDLIEQMIKQKRYQEETWS
ncbi:NADPH-dependent diflavin oxidoreductase 1 [Stomoxys calcitrans]|uniref:NADPH-dependent diflavin oxidoreductase 1 n=1 Tax=Stomoxys calcitrans TaxID=35570 RepID=UPI0027E372CC|nr:NADPH-dependent diflavin oxidoreductase 1 [Stomoxys calcitrans]